MRSGRWVAKRALIGLLLLAMFAAGGSALLYASIEPEAPTAAGE